MQHAYEVLNPDGPAPALLVCDHASRAIPPHLGRLGLEEAFTFEHMAWDIGAGAVTRGLVAALDAPAVLAGWSRLVVDCNRDLDDPTAFLAVSDGVPVPGNANLGEADRRWRIAHCYEPYHQAIEQQLQRRQQRVQRRRRLGNRGNLLRVQPRAVLGAAQGTIGPKGAADARGVTAGSDGDRPVVVSCGSGVNACQLALAMRVAGLPDPLLYPGSYSDWSRAGLPIATGSEPADPPAHERAG